MKDMPVYLDTNILSRLSDLRVSETTAVALAQLANVGSLQFVTSDKTRAEILNTPNPIRNALLQFLFALVDKVRFRILRYSGAYGAAPYGVAPYGGSWTDPVLTALLQVFDQDDAEHIAQAIHADCDFFLTLDGSTILRRACAQQSKLAAICGKLQFFCPEDLVRFIEEQRRVATNAPPDEPSM